MAKLKKFDGREGRPGVHRFDTQLRRGLRGEQHVNAHLAGRYDVSNPQRQSDGIDALYVSWSKRDGAPVVGDRLTHPEYGQGIVERCQEVAGEWMISVKFDPTARKPTGLRMSVRFSNDEYFVFVPVKHYVEIKTDYRFKETGYLFIETVSMDRPTRVRGWAYTSRADCYLFFLPDRGKVFWVPVPTLRGRLPDWESLYEEKAVRNLEYLTKGLLVPLEQVEQISTEVFEIPPLPDSA